MEIVKGLFVQIESMNPLRLLLHFFVPFQELMHQDHVKSMYKVYQILSVLLFRSDDFVDSDQTIEIFEMRTFFLFKVHDFWQGKPLRSKVFPINNKDRSREQKIFVQKAVPTLLQYFL